MSYEKKWNNYKRIVEHLQDNEFQMKMKDRRDRNSDMYTGGGNVKPFGRSNLRFESEGLSLDEADEEVLASFKTQETLNPDVFTNEVMNEDIKKRLAEIADDFVAGIDFDLQVDDITLTGSLANYNWSKYSDFDLHIIVDFYEIDPNLVLVKSLFDNARMS